MASVSLPLRDATGRKRGTLVVSELPDGPRLVAGDSIAEGQRYLYELQGIAGVAQIEPEELFDPDDVTRRHGRIMPGQSVGTLVVVVRCDDAVVVSAARTGSGVHHPVAARVSNARRTACATVDDFMLSASGTDGKRSPSP